MRKEAPQNKPSKAERRIAAREARKMATVAEANRRRNRRLAIGGTIGAGIVLLTALGASNFQNQNQAQGETFHPTPSETQPIDYAAIVAEATRGERDQVESSRWEQIDTSILQIPEDINSQELNNAKDTILDLTKTAMENSSIESFRNGANYLDEVSARHNVEVGVFSVPRSFGVTGPEINNNEILWRIAIDGDSMLAAGGTYTAFRIVHEIEHVKSGIEMREAFPSMSAFDFFNYYWEQSSITENRIAEEARGYGAEAAAVLEAQTALQYPLHNTSEIVVSAANWVMCGQSLGPCWTNYIESNPDFYNLEP